MLITWQDSTIPKSCVKLLYPVDQSLRDFGLFSKQYYRFRISGKLSLSTLPLAALLRFEMNTTSECTSYQNVFKSFQPIKLKIYNPS